MSEADTAVLPAEFAAFLNAQERKGLLRFVTCGSVDDGNSTLIGRLLWDSKLIFDDQPYVWLWNYTLTHGFSNRMRGASLSPAGVFLFRPGIWEWWAAKDD